ncbi:MAG: hypothetical protein HDS56_09560 [Barnesiella sp.]|nr:hypothetical protein [Barnesiella sp.]
MNQLTHAEFVASKAANYNLDTLIEVFACDSDPKKIRRELQLLYFHIVNSFSTGRECLWGVYADAIFTLQNIIEAVDDMEDAPEAATLSVITK